MFWIYFDVKNLIGCVCVSAFCWLLLCYYGSSIVLNVFCKCPAEVFTFSFYQLMPRSDLLFWFVGCVVSVVSVFWLLLRVNSRCQLSLLSFEGMFEMFLLWFFLFLLLIFLLLHCICIFFRMSTHLWSYFFSSHEFVRPLTSRYCSYVLLCWVGCCALNFLWFVLWMFPSLFWCVLWRLYWWWWLLACDRILSW
jgi:hypothetical protein